MTLKTVSAGLTSLFAALADPTRRALLERLAAGDATVLELAEPFDLSQPAITKHLKVLEAAGLVSRSQDGTRRPARLEGEAMQEALQWILALQRPPRKRESRPGATRGKAGPATLPRPWRRL